MIRRLVVRFQEQGSVRDLPQSGRPRSVMNEANIQRVQESVEENPETSTRRRSAADVSEVFTQNIKEKFTSVSI